MRYLAELGRPLPVLTLVKRVRELPQERPRDLFHTGWVVNKGSKRRSSQIHTRGQIKIQDKAEQGQKPNTLTRRPNKEADQSKGERSFHNGDVVRRKGHNRRNEKKRTKKGTALRSTTESAKKHSSSCLTVEDLFAGLSWRTSQSVLYCYLWAHDGFQVEGLTGMRLRFQLSTAHTPYPISASLEDAHLDQGVAHGTRVVLVGGEDQVDEARPHGGLELVHHAEVVKDQAPPPLLVARHVPCTGHQQEDVFRTS